MTTAGGGVTTAGGGVTTAGGSVTTAGGGVTTGAVPAAFKSITVTFDAPYNVALVPSLIPNRVNNDNDDIYKLSSPAL